MNSPNNEDNYTESKSKAVYAFSADPITNGHVNIVERISKTFDHVIVGIGKNPNKKYLFSLEERMHLARQSLSHISNVTVTEVQGMLVDFACLHGAKVIVKGVRNSADFDYEQNLHLVGESQSLGIDTHILFADKNLSHISSSVVKGIQQEHGDIQSYVPLAVKAALEKKVSNQIIVGITGSPACGKSTICNHLVDLGAERGVEIHNIELDYIGHSVFEDQTIPLHREVVRNLINRFGKDIEDNDKGVNRKKLAEIVFSDDGAMSYLNSQMRKPIQILLRKQIYGKKGIILLNGALLIEGNYLGLCNNRVFILTASKEDQHSRMAARGLNEEQIKARIESQYTHRGKQLQTNSVISRDNFGEMNVFSTSKYSQDELANTILSHILANYQ